jgi:hypothetical protein
MLKNDIGMDQYPSQLFLDCINYFELAFKAIGQTRQRYFNCLDVLLCYGLGWSDGLYYFLTSRTVPNPLKVVG